MCPCGMRIRTESTPNGAWIPVSLRRSTTWRAISPESGQPSTTGIYTEWGVDSSFATPFDDLEGYFTGIRSAFNNGNGWTFRGPHDSDFAELVLYQNGGWGMQIQTSSTYNG